MPKAIKPQHGIKDVGEKRIHVDTPSVSFRECNQTLFFPRSKVTFRKAPSRSFFKGTDQGVACDTIGLRQAKTVAPDEDR